MMTTQSKTDVTIISPAPSGPPNAVNRNRTCGSAYQAIIRPINTTHDHLPPRKDSSLPRDPSDFNHTS
jgi:hypothetical protein